MMLSRIQQLRVRLASSSSRVQVVRVQCKVTKKPEEPRIIKGKCYVTRDVSGSCSSSWECCVWGVPLPDADLPAACLPAVQNIDTDQIIPAEYLTLVPSKVGTLGSGGGSAPMPLLWYCPGPLLWYCPGLGHDRSTPW